MLPGSKKVNRLVRVLEKATAPFVSLVDKGANQTPFKVVKSEDGTILATHEDTQLTRGSQAVVGLQKAEFDTDKFTIESATQYLNDFGFTNFEMVEDGDKITAVSKIINKFGKEPATINYGADGVKFYVSEFDTSDGTQDDGVKEQKTLTTDRKTEIIQKFDYWSAEYSYSGSFGEALKAGMWDALPLGLYEAMSAYYGALASAVEDKDYDRIRKVSTDLGEFVAALTELTDKWITDGEVREKVLKALVDFKHLEDKPVTDELKKEGTPAEVEGGTNELPSQTGGEVGEVEGGESTEGGAGNQGLEEGGEAGGEKGGEAPEGGGVSTEAPEGEAVTEAPAEPAGEEVKKSVDSDILAKFDRLLEQRNKDLMTYIDEKSKVQTERMDKFEKGLVARKGADPKDEDRQTSEPVTTAQKSVLNKNLSNVLGL